MINRLIQLDFPLYKFLLLATAFSCFFPQSVSAETKTPETLPSRDADDSLLEAEDPLFDDKNQDEFEKKDEVDRTLKPETPPSLCNFKKFCLFPINLPYVALKSVTYPIAYIDYLIQKYPLPRKTFGFLSNEEKDWSIYPKVWIGDGGNLGFGFGVSNRDLFDRDYRIRFEYLLFTNLAMRSNFIIGNPNAFYAFNRAFSFHVRTQFWREFEQSFYGIGNNSDQDNQARFSKQRLRGGFLTGFEIIPNLVFSFQTFFDTADVGTGSGGPSVQTIFPPSQLPGFQNQITYAIPGFRIVFDTRDNFINSQSGGRRRFVFERYQGLDQGGFNFTQFEFEVDQYIRVGPPRYVLWLRNRWVFQQVDGGNQVPFYRLVELDYNGGLRAFPGGRFRDQGSVVFNVEQRFPLWRVVDGTIFFDAGRVFPGIQNVSFANMKYSVGGGIRVYLGKYYVGIMDGAYGNDGFRVTLKLRNIFFGSDN